MFPAIYGVPKGLMVGQNERVDELNNRINQRQFPDKPLAPNFSSIPVMTKYARFPTGLKNQTANVPINNYNTHDVRTNFNPGTHKAPPSGFMHNVDVETVLRNQHIALQKGANQSVYVPDSTSDLYNVKIDTKPGLMPHPRLFSHIQIEPNWRQSNVENSAVGKDLFHNSTRTQLRSV